MKTKKRQLEKLDIGSVWVRKEVTVREHDGDNLPWSVYVGHNVIDKYMHRHEAIAAANQFVLKESGKETVERPHFDGLPELKKPNPLPCGCGIVGVRGINRDGTAEEWRDKAIRFCPLHEAAKEMFEALKAMDAAIDGYHLSGFHDMNDLARCEARQKMRNAIAKVQSCSPEKP